jgi:hypothetical protein
MKGMNINLMSVLKFLVDANFYISIFILLYGAFSAMTHDYSIFEFNEDLYGIMHSNLRMALLYLGMTETVILIYCYATKQPRLLLFAGYFLIMMLGSLTFYGKINTVPIDENMLLFFLYTGISHVLYGLASGGEYNDAGTNLSGNSRN